MMSLDPNYLLALFCGTGAVTLTVWAGIRLVKHLLEC